MIPLTPLNRERSVSPFAAPAPTRFVGVVHDSNPPLHAGYPSHSPDGLDAAYHRNPIYGSQLHVPSEGQPQISNGRRPSRVTAFGHSASHQLRRLGAAPSSDILSVKASFKPGLYLALGLLGRVGYGIGPALIEHQLVDIAPPPGATPGPGAGGEWQGLPLGWSALVTGLGASLSLVSSLCFLNDALKIPGNRGRAFFYFSMHCLAICLISASRAIIDVTKTRLPREHLLIAVLPAAFGLGVHWVTIPRSFATSEIVHGNFLPIRRLEQRQMLAEVVQFTAAIFIALWAASNGLATVHPLEREGFLVAGSIAVILGFALPNTNWRRAHREQLKRQVEAKEACGSVGAIDRGEAHLVPVFDTHLESPLSEILVEDQQQPMLGSPGQVRSSSYFHDDQELALKRVTTS